MSIDDMRVYQEALVRALTTMDMDFARAHNPRGLSDDVLLMGMHKARAMHLAIAGDLRWQSIEWLRAHGCRLATGEPLP